MNIGTKGKHFALEGFFSPMNLEDFLTRSCGRKLFWSDSFISEKGSRGLKMFLTFNIFIYAVVLFHSSSLPVQKGRNTTLRVINSLRMARTMRKGWNKNREIARWRISHSEQRLRLSFKRVSDRLTSRGSRKTQFSSPIFQPISPLFPSLRRWKNRRQLVKREFLVF